MKQTIRVPVFIGPAGSWYVPCYFPDSDYMPEPTSRERLVLVVAEVDVPDVEEVPGRVESPDASV